MVKIIVYHSKMQTGAGRHKFKAEYTVPSRKVKSEIAFFRKIGVKAVRKHKPRRTKGKKHR